MPGNSGVDWWEFNHAHCLWLLWSSTCAPLRVHYAMQLGKLIYSIKPLGFSVVAGH
jgi:hypothetical protein